MDKMYGLSKYSLMFVVRNLMCIKVKKKERREI